MLARSAHHSASVLFALTCWATLTLPGQVTIEKPARRLTAYAITSSYNWEHSDPGEWRLLASNDEGHTWTLLDSRTNERFSQRSQRRVFTVTNEVAFNLFRLEVTDGDPDFELAELELLGPLLGFTNEAELELNITASNEHSLVGPATQAFDHDPATKWLGFSSPDDKKCWVQCQYTRQANPQLLTANACSIAVRRQANLSPLLYRAPQILARLQASASTPLQSLAGYALTSANDYPGRDPRDWRLMGSNDGGKSWETLDERHNETFATRFQRRVFKLSKVSTYATYRLDFLSVRAPLGGADGANSLQLAEIEPLAANSAAKGPYSLAILAHGDNPPIETAEMAFDGDSQTKWLDYANEANTNKATWIQWQYFTNEEPTVLNMRRLFAAQNHPLHPPRVKLQGVVASWDSESGLLGFLDSTGLQMFKLRLGPNELAPGKRIRLTGVLQTGAQIPSITEPEILVLGELPRQPEKNLPPSFDSKLDFLSGTFEGAVTSIAETSRGITVTLSPESGHGTLVARILGPKPERLDFDTGSRLGVEGILSPVVDEHGIRVPGAIWVPSMDHVHLLEPNLTAEIAQPHFGEVESPRPTTSIANARKILGQQPLRSVKVTIRGVITYIDLSFDYFYVQEGPDGISIGTQLAAGLAAFMQKEGKYVEVQTLTSTNQPGLVAIAPAIELGDGVIPPPLHHPLDNLMTGIDDSRWVQVEGIVSSCEEHRITLNVIGGRLMVWINELDKNLRARLVGCHVRVNGVCSPLTNTRNRRLGVRILVPNSECIQIVSRPPGDLFTLRTQNIGTLLKSEWRRVTLPTVLAKTSGIVTHKEGLMVFLQDGTDGLRVWLRTEAELEPGDFVEAVGFTEPDGFSTRLVQAAVRKVGRATLPSPKPIDSLNNDLSDYDSVLARIEATYVGRRSKDSIQILELQDNEQQQTFSAFFPTDGGIVPQIPSGSRVRLRGVLKAETDTLPDFGKVMTSFQIYANSPRDLVVRSRPAWWNLKRTLWYLAAACAAAVISLAWVGLLRRKVAQRTAELRAEIEQRRKTAASLEAEIAERKRMQDQVEHTHQALVNASRLAGMAEVASNVLHNVGNVLNSINISASLVATKLKGSKTNGLARAAKMMKEHQNDLAEFITNHPKGRQLPEYLERLSKHLLDEQDSASTELASLIQNVDHVKEIVAMQQRYAKVAGVTERVSPIDLVEDSLCMPAHSLARSAVQVIRQFEADVPEITIDRHKVIQIIVNLLQNALHACVESNRPDKRVTISVALAHDRILITVADNGVGIPPENLTRIFSHGFTTRKEGHGFGLHSSALAAKELGGTLMAQSDGWGMGAKFILELPLQPRSA